MGQARWAGPNWPDILEGRAVKLAARIKFGPIGPTRIGCGPIGLNFFFKIFLLLIF